MENSYTGRVLRQATVLIVLFLIPSSALARQDTVWDFRDGNVPGRWEVRTMAPPTPSPEGLLIHTESAGHMLQISNLEHDIESVSFTYESARALKAKMLFRVRSGGVSGPMLELPFSVQATHSGPTTVHLDVGVYGNWDPRPTEIGFFFPAGTQMLLQEVTLSDFNATEKLWQGFLSFWTYDTFKSYTVNFVWGPRLATTPAQRMQIFARTPPRAGWGNWVFYTLAIMAVATIALQRLRGRIDTRKGATLVAATIAALWLLYDARMGTEFLYYAVHDWRTYWSQELQQRVLRGRGGFHAFAEWAAPRLREEEEYVFLPVVDEFAGFLRYITYPSLPIRPTSGTGGHLWAVFLRPDVAVNQSGSLMQNGQPLSPPGTVIDTWTAESFLFQTFP